MRFDVKMEKSIEKLSFLLSFYYYWSDKDCFNARASCSSSVRCSRRDGIIGVAAGFSTVGNDLSSSAVSSSSFSSSFSSTSFSSSSSASSFSSSCAFSFSSTFSDIEGKADKDEHEGGDAADGDAEEETRVEIGRSTFDTSKLSLSASLSRKFSASVQALRHVNNFPIDSCI